MRIVILRTIDTLISFPAILTAIFIVVIVPKGLLGPMLAGTFLRLYGTPRSGNMEYLPLPLRLPLPPARIVYLQLLCQPRFG